MRERLLGHLTIVVPKTRPDPLRATVSWWIATPREGFTDLCETQTARMLAGPAANKVTDLKPGSWWTS
jgi:hypothetical protein